MARPDQNQSPLPRPVALSHVIESQLEKILRSDIFTKADSLRRLLRFVVDETVAGRGEDIKEYSLGVSVLGKGDSFDPKADPIVRVQMRRLREHLARYYASDGRREPLIIDIPKGRYMPAFRAGDVSVATVREEGLSVGREREIAALQSAFDSSVAGEGRMLCLAGEPGIGKTTVAEMFLRRLSASGARCTIGRARCSERLAGTDAYLPMIEALESLVDAGGEAVRRLLMDAAPTWYLQIAPHLDSASPAAQQEPVVASAERLKRELVAFLPALARECPLVLLLDDLHWADVPTVDALAYAMPRFAADRILIVGTFRPAELLTVNQPFLRVKLELQGHGLCREIPLPPLTRADVDSYLARQFPDHKFPADLAARIHSRTEGNPLFMVDLVGLLRDRGVLAQSDGRWTMPGELTEVERDLPESVRSMVQKKIGELIEGDRKLMSAAAVLGPQFESTILAEALMMDVAEVEERLEALDRTSGFVRLVGERVLANSTLTLEYGFVHLLYQQALYGALTSTRRTALSGALAEALLRAYGENAAEVASRLALLFEAGRNFARASDFFLVASQNAGRLYAAEQAIALARQSIANAERLEGPERHGRVLAAAFHSAQQHQSITRFDAAIADFELAGRAAQALDDAVAQVHALFGQAAVLFLAKRIPQVRECGTRAMDIARTAGSDGAVAASTAIVALAGLCAGDDVKTAERQLDEAIPVLQRCGFVPHALIAVLVRGLLHTWRLEHAQAESDLSWTRGTAATLHSTFEVMTGLWHQARARGNQGRLSEAQDMLEEALRLAELTGDRFWRPRIENTRGWLLAEVFDTETALQLNTGAVRMAQEFGDVEAECNSHINAARDYLTLGEPSNALPHLQRAEALYRDDVWFRWVYYPRLQAEMASYWLTQGDLRLAESCARVSLEDAERTSCRKRVVWARKLLGDIAMLDDRPEDARRELGAALAVLAQHPCPPIEWQVLRSAGAAAGMIDGDEARRELLARAGTVVHALARSIRNPLLEATFSCSQPIRELLTGHGQ
jgi:tetratricopeptide (TPR) repeat protein